MRSIRNKILGLIGIVAAGAAIALAFALVALSGIEGMGHRVSRQNDVALATERLNVAVNQLSEDSRLAYMARNPNEAKNAAAAIEKGLNQLNDRLKIFTAIVPANERERATKIGQLVAEFAGIRAETAKLAQEVSGRAADAWGNSEASRRNRAALIEELGGFSQLNEQAGNAVEAESSDYVARMRMLIPLTLLVLLGISVAAAIAFSRRAIVKPLLDLGGVMDRLIAGDTAIEVPHTQRRDEIGAMARSVSVLRETSEQVALLQQQEQAAAAARLARAQSMEAVVSDVGEVVAAAAAGDFSARLQIDQADEQMQKLVAGINEINAVVDSATSEFARTLSAVAAGDLTVRVDAAYRGKFAELKGAINETVERLSSTVKTIQVTSADVGLAAREINMGADDLSKRTEEQASSLEETAATTEELAASVKASAQASRQAAAIATEAMEAAQNGGAIAGQAVDAMARIETASQKISDIIRVIDDIAFQTNLLALNAAVEAARAGDAGKGFAVVASEVRTLAQRSGSAAKDISALISSSNTEVGEGVKLVRQAGEALEQILSASRKVASTIAEISAASGEQASGIDEMSQAVAHLDEMTQQNAALSEQSAASAGSLSGKIAQLNDLVAAFKTGPESAGLSPEIARSAHASTRRAA
ncbi:methyl-accepting chemotaxis protein [Bosea sp. (in: a-proteobacteria)]|uniref:methyl-accepting chemotaxis protein n=1 Tax=Bosea sp. (in: a-proteobacteria) TaxID=1871050 RepID=UPI0025C348FB|nr:methyl-accepting chemotaxis protein [Bosea sp. (in: a-proteobacteria)]WRH57597.1 MAG: methyl-accepting chemotaxis protein [Bosea sp. (in: a-proteobacteria)]